MKLTGIVTETEAIREQERLSRLVVKEDLLPLSLKKIAGVDVAYEKEGDLVIAAISVLDYESLEILETVTWRDKVSFPYIPGLFSFRELPPVLKAWEMLSEKPDILVCDGQGIAHPRRFGLASHLGVVLDVPAIGCAKKRLHGEYEMPGEKRGELSPLQDKDEIIGNVLRTQNGTRPVFVSVGHRVSLETSTAIVLYLCREYRLPETTRAADHAVRVEMKRILDRGK